MNALAGTGSFSDDELDWVIDKVWTENFIINDPPYLGHEEAIVKFNMNHGDNVIEISFGSLAISESMAYLMEKKLVPDSSKLSTFKYNAVAKIAEYYNPEIAANEELLFVMCDLAMMTTNPGNALLIILAQINIVGITNFNSQNMYEQILAIKEEYIPKTTMTLDEILINLKGKIGTLLYHEQLKDTRIWFNHIVSECYELRVNNIPFMQMLYNTPLYNGIWNDMLVKIGTPECTNGNNERWFKVPQKLKNCEDNVNPIYFTALDQIFRVLYPPGRNFCKMIPTCELSKDNSFMDDNCYDSPWKRPLEGNLCPFSTLWVTFGLEKKIRF